MIIKTPKRKQFVAVGNSLAQDKQLSFEARGVLVYLLSHPENWRVLGSDIERSGNIGAEKRRRVMAELEEAGYITSHRIQGLGGHWGWEFFVHETPVDVEKRTVQLGRGARNRSVKNRTSVQPEFGSAEVRTTALEDIKFEGSKTKEEKRERRASTAASIKAGEEVDARSFSPSAGKPTHKDSDFVDTVSGWIAGCCKGAKYTPQSTLVRRTARALAERFDHDLNLLRAEHEPMLGRLFHGDNKYTLKDFRQYFGLEQMY